MGKLAADAPPAQDPQPACCRSVAPPTAGSCPHLWSPAGLWILVRGAPGSPGPTSPLWGRLRGASRFSDSTGRELILAYFRLGEALICCVFTVFPSPLERASGSQFPRPEGGTIKSRGPRVNRSTPPPAAPTHPCTILQEINKKWFVSICLGKIKGFPLWLVRSAPSGPFEPWRGRAIRMPCGGEPLIELPAILFPSEPVVGQGSCRAPGGTDATPGPQRRGTEPLGVAMKVARTLTCSQKTCCVGLRSSPRRQTLMSSPVCLPWDGQKRSLKA